MIGPNYILMKKIHEHDAQEEMDIVIDLINRVEEQEALVVQSVRRPKTRLETLVDDATLRTRAKALQLQVQYRACLLLLSPRFPLLFVLVAK